MSVSVADFWRLLADSRLLARPEVQQLTGEFSQIKQPETPTAKSLAQWLVARKAVTRYQASVLLAGRSGPFYYGDYKVVDRCSDGRFVGCYRAVHTASSHPVLLKFLSGPLLNDSRLYAAAANNTAAAASIVSPHLQRYFEAVDLPKFKFLVSEDLRGNTLEEKVAAGRLPPPEACRIARLAALGLAQMHAGGRVHGSLRAANILLEPNGKLPANVKLLFDAHELPGPVDFADQQPSGPLALIADYLAPELWSQGRAPDVLTDIYALGCTLYYMLSGSLPFAGGSVQQKFARHANEAVRPLTPLGVPQPVEQLVTYLLAKNPGVRCGSAQAAAEQLAVFVEPSSLSAPPPTPQVTLAPFEAAMRIKQASAPSLAAPAPSVSLPLVLSDAASASGPTLAFQVRTKSRPGRSADEILRSRKKQRQRNLVIGLVTTLLMIAALGGAGVWWSRNRPAGATLVADRAATGITEGRSASSYPGPVSTPDVNVVSAVPAAASGLEVASASADTSRAVTNKQQIVADDGKTPWASPTSGQPVSFRCLPPEGQVFLILRPEALLANEEGARVIAALGPRFTAQREAWEAASGFKLDDIEQLLVTLHNNDSKFPRTSFVVRTKDPFTPDQLLARWGNPPAAMEKSETYYSGPQWAYYISRAPEDERTFAMGSARDVKEVAAIAGAPPAVFPQIERLRRATDGERHFTLLFYPQFLFNDDGEPLFAAERAKIRQPLAWLLGDHLQAVAVSAELGEALYLELRLLASLDREPYQLAEELHERLNKVPAALEDYFVALEPPPYWKKLAFRYPGMARELHSQLRVGVENDQAVINTVLPLAAAHNLVLGGELLVATAPGTTASAASTPAAAGPQTIADALQLKTSFSFDQQSLEFAMRDLTDDVQGNLKNAPVEFTIKIIGDDLKLDGITRNQSIRDFKQEQQSVANILTALVRKANPVTTVKDPSETDQKLVWLIGPDPDAPGKQCVLITTRAAAATKKYTLPPVFAAKTK